MTTAKQTLGNFGEKMVVENCHCPKCKKQNTLKLLPKNFKCADVICDFCGYLAQVKTKNVKDINKVPNTILGAAWKPQKERMEAGIYFPLFLVLVSKKNYSIYYLPVDFQTIDMFVPRKPLSKDAKRAGWQGFIYDMQKIKNKGLVKLI